MNILEHLILIDKARILIIDNNLEAKVGLLPYQQVNFLSMLISSWLFVKIMLYLCRGNKTIALFVKMNINDIAIADSHTLLLFTERTEEVFHHTPREECTILIHPRTLQVSKVAYLRQRFLSSSNRAFILIEINKYFQFIPNLRALWDILLRYENLTSRSTIKVDSEWITIAFT